MQSKPDIPRELRDLFECIIVPGAVDRWLNKPDIFDGLSPYTMLRSGEQASRVVDLFYHALGYASAPGIIPYKAMMAKIDEWQKNSNS